MFESVGNLDECRIGGIVLGILKMTSCFGIAHTFLLEVSYYLQSANLTILGGAMKPIDWSRSLRLDVFLEYPMNIRNST
jgi:hypothetical protein